MKRNEWIYATPKQEALLRILAAEAFANRYSAWGGGSEPKRRLLKSEASRYITELLAAKKQGWGRAQPEAKAEEPADFTMVESRAKQLGWTWEWEAEDFCVIQTPEGWKTADNRQEFISLVKAATNHG